MKSTTRNDTYKIILVGFAIFLVQGCNQITAPGTPRDEASTKSAPPTEIQGVVTQMNTQQTPAASSGLENLLNQVKADLAQRLSISVDQIDVVESEQVEWSDSSLGCPQPGMFYMQVITPGYRIVLKSGGQQYEYHSGRAASFVYCENPLPPVESAPGNT